VYNVDPLEPGYGILHMAARARFAGRSWDILQFHLNVAIETG
jgi:hypothetical protein